VKTTRESNSNRETAAKAGTARKVRKGPERTDTPILKGYQPFHNCVRAARSFRRKDNFRGSGD